MSLATLYVTAPSKEVAEKIGRELLEKRLVACVNIVDNVTSLYWWEDTIQHDQEVVMVCKTLMRIVHRCSDVIKEVHPYDVPCITVMPVLKWGKEFGEWVKKEVDG